MFSIYSDNILDCKITQSLCLYADLTNFSQLSKECLDEHASIEAMKKFYILSVQTIKENKGILLSFMGDGFLAIWNLTTSSRHVVDTVIKITEGTSQIINDWINHTNGQYSLPKGIKFSATLSYVTAFVDKDKKVLNAFSNQLNQGARLLSVDQNINNCICLTKPALKWFGFETNNIKFYSEKVKKDSVHFAIIPIAKFINIT